jgi:predicted ester cyclase
MSRWMLLLPPGFFLVPHTTLLVQPTHTLPTYHTLTGKHTGNLLGYPPTRKVVAWMGATEFTCQNGKILKVWELGDIKTLEEQLTNLPDDSEEV